MYEPKIIGFLCNWCSYAAADLAGTSRIQYPSNIRVIRVMCSSRVGPEHILYALLDDETGSKVLRACGVNIPKLKKKTRRFFCRSA